MAISDFYSALMVQLTPVAPVAGVAFDDINDKTKWRIVYNNTPTPTQKSAAESVVVSFDVAGATATKQSSDSSCVSDSDFQDMMNKLASASATQIKNYVQNNSSADVGTKTLIAKILLILANLI